MRTYYEDSNGKVFGKKHMDSLVDTASLRSQLVNRNDGRDGVGKAL